MIWNGRQGVTGAAVEDNVSSRWIHISALGSAHLFFGLLTGTQKVTIFKRLEKVSAKTYSTFFAIYVPTDESSYVLGR